MALRTILGAANQKGKPAFLHFEKPTPDKIKKDSVNIDLNKVMENMGGEAFVYDTFKVAYDSDPRIKEMVKNFSGDGIELKTKEDADASGTTSADGGDTVAAMAKSATNVGDKL